MERGTDAHITPLLVTQVSAAAAEAIVLSDPLSGMCSKLLPRKQKITFTSREKERQDLPWELFCPIQLVTASVSQKMYKLV